MIIINEKKTAGPPIKPVYLTESQIANIKKAGLFEANNLPALAKQVGIAANPKITNVVRQDTIFSTCQAMGLPTKINAMKNVVVECPDPATMTAVLQTIYNSFGVRGSMMITWDNKGKVYFSPETPPDSSVAIAYARATGLPSPNPRKYLA
jgi:hypothetical protein